MIVEFRAFLTIPNDVNGGGGLTDHLSTLFIPLPKSHNVFFCFFRGYKFIGLLGHRKPGYPALWFVSEDVRVIEEEVVVDAVDDDEADEGDEVDECCPRTTAFRLGGENSNYLACTLGCPTKIENSVTGGK